MTGRWRTAARGPVRWSASWTRTAVAPCALLCVLARADRVPAAFEGNHCVSCHETERLPISLGHSFEEWHASAHARAGVGCEKCHGGDPSVSDAAAAHRGVLPAMEADSMVHTRRIVATCGACHPKELAAYQGTIHARQVQERGTGATCFTCHGSMATSLPSPSELSARCGVCHKKPIQTQAALAVMAMAKHRPPPHAPYAGSRQGQRPSVAGRCDEAVSRPGEDPTARSSWRGTRSRSIRSCRRAATCSS